MKYLIIFSLILFSLSAASAQTAFKDVAQGHWAEASIYKLVKLGVTKGYPDGTFRGQKYISRYEIAAFLAKLANSLNREQAVNEKLIAELKSELALIKYELMEAGGASDFQGSFISGARISKDGSKLDYRLILSQTRNFNKDSSLKLRLDTVDAGFNSDTDRPLATKLIDIESKFRIGRIYYTVNLAPGVVPHTEADDLFPSDNYIIYIRPKTGVSAATWIGKMGLNLSYVTRQVETSGKIGVHEVTAKVDYDYGDMFVYLRPRYLFIIDGPSDALVEGGVNYKGINNWETQVLLAAGNFQAGRSGMYLKLIEKMKDPFNTGTNVTLRFDKVGSKYRHDIVDEYEFIYLNNFGRLILDGTVDLGLAINQKLVDKLAFEWKGDYVATGDYSYGADYPETYLLWQAGLNYQFSSSISMNTFYRAYNVPSGMAQFGDAVPAVSEMVGIGINSRF